MSVSSQTRGSVVEQLIFCEKRIEELEEQNYDLLEALVRIKDSGAFVGAIAQEMMDSAIAKARGEE